MGTKISKTNGRANGNRKKEGLVSRVADGGAIIGQDKRESNENAVCMVTSTNKNNITHGTGTFVTLDGKTSWILTNNHIISAQQQCSTTTFEFGFVSQSSRGTVFTCDPDCLFITDQELDYSLISFEMEGKYAEEDERFRPIDLSNAPMINPSVGSVINTVQHPRGELRSFSAQAITSVKKYFIQYKADTDYGSSGCAVFLNGNLIAIHHTYVKKENVNEGTLISSITDDIVAQQKFVSLKLKDKWIGSRKYLNVLLFGRTGQGKSALVNALSGKSYPEDDVVETKEVTEYNVEVNGVKVTFYDTPGLFDGRSQNERYLKGISSKNIDLVLFCSDFTQKRHGDDAQNIKMIEEVVSLGESVCKRCIVVLTFANNFQPPRWKKMKTSEKRNTFSAKLKILVQQYQTLFARCSSEKGFSIARIPVVPAGYQDEMDLPDRDNWLGELWTTIIENVRYEATPAFWRFTMDSEVLERFNLTKR